MNTPHPHVSRTASRIVRAAATLVPSDRRAEWIERWDGELCALSEVESSRRRQCGFALGALPDAVVEGVHGWREGWTLAGLSGDVRLALRRARREPVTTAIAIVVAGAGAAAATSLFALFDATLLRTPPALSRPNELLQVGRDGRDKFDNFSYPNFRDLADAAVDAVTLTAYGTGLAVVGTGQSADVVDVQFAAGNFFDVLGVSLSHGSGAWPAERTGADAVVLSERHWHDHRATIEAAGLIVIVDGRRLPVVGVAPAGFAGVSIGAPPPAMWLPLHMAERAPRLLSERGWSWLNIIGRRRSGVTLAAATVAITAAHRRLAPEHHNTIGDNVTVDDRVGFRPADRREAMRVFALLMGLAALVLLVATANLTGLQLARAAANHRASAIRVSLGASRARLVRATLVDQMLLASAGGFVAWLMAQWLTGAIRAMLPYDLAVGFAPGPRTLAFSLVLPAVFSAIVAIVPSWRATRPRLSEVLNRGGRALLSRTRASTALVAAEVALSTALLVAAGLMIRSLDSAATVDPGFNAHSVTVINIRRQPTARPVATVRASIVDQLRHLPGTDAVGLATRLPIARPQSTRTLFPEDSAYDPDARPLAVVTNAVDRGFFDALKIPVPVLEQWDAVPSDPSAPWPLVVTATTASRLWPQPDALRVVTSGEARLTLAASIPDIRTRSLKGAPSPAMFLPIARTNDMASYVLVRSRLSDRDAAAACREALAPLAADVIVGQIGPYEPLLVASLSETIMAARLGVPLACVAVLLAAVGLYSAASRRVVERRREFGVRLALGASPASIARAELVSALCLSAPAVMIGVLLVGAAQPVLSSIVFGVNWADPAVLSMVAMIVLGLTATAAVLPARRAGRTDPLEAFRD